MKGNHLKERRSRGFSLLELLIVFAVISLLLGIVVTSVQYVGPSLSLSRAGDELAESLLEARQKAIAASDAVEVRFYDLESTEDNDFVTVYQLVYQKSDGTYRAENPVRLPTGIGISRNPRLSSFFQSEGETPGRFLIRGAAGPQLPEDNEAKYIAFRYLPDGSTNLPEAKWFLTVAFDREEESASVPDNFYTIQIDPVMGQIQTFRP